MFDAAKEIRLIMEKHEADLAKNMFNVPKTLKKAEEEMNAEISFLTRCDYLGEE